MPVPALPTSLTLDPDDYVWLGSPGTRAPAKLMAGTDTLSAREAFKHMTQGYGIVWQGDFNNARQLLQALGRRLAPPRKPVDPATEKATPLLDSPLSSEERRALFHTHRQHQSQRAALLNRLLLPVLPDGTLPLRRAPDIREACQAAGLTYFQTLPGDASDTVTSQPGLLPLRQLQGMIGGLEWQKKGVHVAGLSRPVHVSHGVFSPVRGEYIELLWKAPLPGLESAADIGTGSGVLAAILAARGVRHVMATDTNPRAIACARTNIENLALSDKIQLLETAFFPPGKFDLLVCNPPWLPARPTSLIEQAVYDPDHAMLLGFLDGVADHLTPGGEAWLILSDLAEHLGLREADFLTQAFGRAGLDVAGTLTARPRHGKAVNADDLLGFARSRETTTLWRLRRRS